MHRTLLFDLDELWHDHEDVAERVNHACHSGQEKLRVRGLAQIGDTVYVYLLPAGDETAEQYVLAPWEDESVEGVSTCLSERWSAGFDLAGAIRLEEGRHLLLFVRVDSARA